MKKLSNPSQPRRTLCTSAAALACVAAMTGCMARSPEMVNVEPSFVHDRISTPDERTAAAWPVMPSQQARAQRKARQDVAEIAFLEN